MKKQFRIFTLLFFSAAVFVSCSEDETSKPRGAKIPPVIDSVSRAAEGTLEPTTVGLADNMYIIQGKGFLTTQKVYFNDTPASFNPALLTDDTLFAVIDINTPYADAPNKLRVETLYGTVEYDFVVAPPAPSFKSFQPINAADGEMVTLYGSFFLDPVVTVGTTQAEIVSNTLTEIQIILPAGSQLKKIKVETISGVSQYNTAVGTAIFDDAFYAPWDIESWNNFQYVDNPAQAAQGNVFIKKTIPGWDNIQGNWNYDDQLSGYTGIHFYVRSDDAGKLVWIVNGNGWGEESHAINTTTEWTEVRLTWAQMGNPAAFQNLSFQEFTGSSHNYYLDNIGYTVD